MENIFYILAGIIILAIFFFLEKSDKKKTTSEVKTIETKPNIKTESLNQNKVTIRNSDTEGEIVAAISAALHFYEEDKQKENGFNNKDRVFGNVKRRNSNWAKIARNESHQRL